MVKLFFYRKRKVPYLTKIENYFFKTLDLLACLAIQWNRFQGFPDKKETMVSRMFFGNKCAAKDVKILCLSSFKNSFVYNV